MSDGIIIKLKEKDCFEALGRKDLNWVPGATIIKLFHNVPKADLEMLFANSRVRMKTIDKLIIGVPAAVSGIVMVVTKLGATLILVGSVVAFWLGLSQEEITLNQKHLIAMGAGLAYFFLHTEKRPLPEKELDDIIEKWFETRYNCKVDFEIADALNKLERLELVTRAGGMLQAKPLSEAKCRLDVIWDNYFRFNSEVLS